MPEVRSEFRDAGTNRACAGLARALRSNMGSAGWHKIDAYQDDDFAAAESQYRRDTEQESPVNGTAQFRLDGKQYLFDLTRPHLRAALELHLPPGKRSKPAQYLAALLHCDELHREHLVEATPALLQILEQIRPFN